MCADFFIFDHGKTNLMSTKDTSLIVRHGCSSLSQEEQEGWVELFQTCFKKSRNDATSAFRKYKLHSEDSIFCMGVVDGVIVACYSGILFRVNGIKIILSTDTMSCGVISNATAKLGRILYDYLTAIGVTLACGFPNDNIIKIREKKLGWKMIGALHAYVGLPVLWRYGRPNSVNDQLWYLKRPDAGFFMKTYSWLTLLGRYGLYSGNILSLVLTLSAQRPGMFFVKVPSLLVAPKQFGYALLNQEATEAVTFMQDASRRLDLNTIDVP